MKLLDTCPNWSLPKNKELIDLFGKGKALAVLTLNNNEPIEPEKALKMLHDRATVVDNLRAWDTGSAKDEKEIDALIVRDPNAKVGGGESFNQIKQRSIRTAMEILDKAPYGSVIVTHDSVLKFVMLWDKLGRPNDWSKITPEAYVKLSTHQSEQVRIDGPNGKTIWLGHTKEADELGDRFANQHIPMAFTSSLPRTLQTTDRILEKQKSNVSMFQMSSKGKPDESMNRHLAAFVNALKGEIRSVPEIVINGKRYNATAVTDIINRVISVVDGKAGLDTLPEEAGHLFTEYLPENSSLLKAMMKDIVTRPIYDQVMEEYEDNPLYRRDGEVNEDKIAREAIGKMIAQAITNKWKSQREKSVWQKLWDRLWSWIKTIVGKGRDPYEAAAGEILGGRTGKLDLNKVMDAEKQGKYFYLQTDQERESEEHARKLYDAPGTTDEQKVRLDQIVLNPKNKITLDGNHEYSDDRISDPSKYTPGTKAIGGVKNLGEDAAGTPKYELNRKFGNYFDAIFRGVSLGKGIDEIDTFYTDNGVKKNIVHDSDVLQQQFDSQFKQKAYDIAKRVYDNEVSDGSIVISQPILSYKAPRAINNIASSADFLVISPSGKVSNIDLKTSWHSINDKNSTGTKKLYDIEYELKRDLKNPENNSWLVKDGTSVSLSKRDQHILQLMLHQELLRKMGVKNFGNFRNYYIHLVVDEKNATNPTLLDAIPEGFSKDQIDDLPRVYEDLMEKILPEEQSDDPLNQPDPKPDDNQNPNPEELTKPLLMIAESLQKRVETLLSNVRPETANKLKEALFMVEALHDNYKVEALMRFIRYAQDFTNRGLELATIDYKRLAPDAKRNYFKFLMEARDIANSNLDLVPESVEVVQGSNKVQIPMLSLLNQAEKAEFNKLRADMNSLRIQSTLAMVNYVVETGANEFDIKPVPGETRYDAAKRFLFGAMHDITMFMKEADAPSEMRDTLLGKINDIIRKTDIKVSVENEKIKAAIDKMANDYGVDLSKKENGDFMFDLDKTGKRIRLKQRVALDFLEEKRAIDESILNPDGSRKEFIENPQDDKDEQYNKELAAAKQKHSEFYDPETGIDLTDQREGTHYHFTDEYKTERAKVMRYIITKYGIGKWIRKNGVTDEDFSAFRNKYMIFNEYWSADRNDTGEFTGTVTRKTGWFPNKKYTEVNDNKYEYKLNVATDTWEQHPVKSLENPEYKKLMATDTSQRKLFTAYRDMFEKAIEEGGPEVEEWYARGGLIALKGHLFDKGLKSGAGNLLKSAVDFDAPQNSDRSTTENGQVRHNLHVPFISNLKNEQRIKAIEKAINEIEVQYDAGNLRDDSGKQITTIQEKNKYRKMLEDKLKIENKRVDASDLEADPLKALNAFVEGVNMYKHMSDIEGQLLAMQQVVNQEISLDPNDKRTVRQYYGDEREFARRGMDTAFKQKNEVRSIAVLDNIIKNFYGDNVEKKTIDMIAKKFMTWTSASAMGLNIPNNLNNFILYSFNSARQGMAGRFMSWKNMRKGFNEVEFNYFPGIAKKAFRKIGEKSFDYKDKSESKVEAMMKHFNINAEEYFKQQGADSWISKFYIGEKLAVQHAEYGMATGYMMDQVLKDSEGNVIKIKKDGKETPVSLWDAYKFNNNTGDLELIDELKGRESEFEREEKNIIIRAKDIQIKTQGNYDARSRTLLDNHLLGRLLLQFHRFWKPAWNDRFAKQYTHSSLGEMEGTWTSMYSVVKMMKEFDDHWTTQLSGGWKGFYDRAKAAGYSDERIDLLKKNLITDLVEVLTVSSLFAMAYTIGKAAIAYHKKHPDMDPNTIRFMNYWQYTASRIGSEEMTFTPGINLILLTELINNPFAVSRTLKNFGQAIRLSVQYPINEMLGEHDKNYYQKGIYKGQSKAYVRLRKSIPFWQVYDKWMMFSQMNDYNNVLAGATGSAKSD